MTIRERCVPCLEFKSDDDAWYDVSIELEDNKIKIHYEGFSDDCDEELALEDFKNVDEFKAKFRLSSRQLQDKYCRKVMQGGTVCASCTADEEDTRFFDARVEKGTEVFKCSFCTCRPWVVLDVQNRLCEGSFGGYSAESKVMQPSCGKTPSKKIQIFHKGTPEYEQAKIFKERFLELREHLILLHKRLEHEESRV